MRKNLLRFRKGRAAERGAADPILVIAGIAVTITLLIGGSFAVSAFISHSRDMDARGELSRIATAQSAYFADNDRYAVLATGPRVVTKRPELAAAPEAGFTPSNNNTIVRTSRGGWTAVTESGSGKVFIRTSDSLKTLEIPGSVGPAPSALGPPVLSRTNLATVPDGSYFKSGTEPGAGFESGRWGADGVYTNQRDMDDGPPGTNLTSYARWTAGAAAQTARSYGYHLAGNVEGAISPGMLPVTPGQVLTISTYWRADSDTTASLRVRFGNSTAWVGSTVNGPSSARSNGQWVRVSQTITVPANVTRAAFNVHGAAGVLPGGRLEATGLLVDVHNGLRPYIDGTPSGDVTLVNAWTGLERRSTSTQSTRAVLNNTTAWNPTYRPSDVELPIGISWENVVADIQAITR